MRYFSVVVPLLLTFSSHGHGGALGKLFCPTICNPNPKEPLRTCFYKCGFLKYGKYFDGSRCWYLVGTGKIINSKGYCNQGICLKVFTSGYEGSAAQRNCEVHQTKVPSKGETGVKGSNFNATQTSEHGPSENYTRNATAEWHGISLEPTTPARTPNIVYTKAGLSEAHEGVTVTLGTTNTAAPHAGLTTAVPPAESTTAASPAGIAKAPPAAELATAASAAEPTTAAPAAELMTAAPPAGLTTAGPRTGIAKAPPPAELPAAAPAAELMTDAPPADLTTVGPPAGIAKAPPPAELPTAAPAAELTTAAPPAQLTTAGTPAGIAKAPPPAKLTKAAPPAELMTAAPPAELTMAGPPPGIRKAAPPAKLPTASPAAELTMVAPLAGLTTAEPPAELMTVEPPAGITTVAPPAEQTTVAPPGKQTKAVPPTGLTTDMPAAGRTAAAALAELTTVEAPAGFTMAAPPSGPTKAPPPTELTTAATPAGLTEAQASTHDKRNAPHSIRATPTTSTSREHIANTTKEGVSLSTFSPELRLPTEENTVPPAAPSTTVLSPGSIDRYQKGTSSKEAETSTATATEMPVLPDHSPAIVLPAVTPTPATEHGLSKNYTTNATAGWPGLSLEPTAPATPPNVPFTNADLSKAHEVVTVTLGTSTAAPPARLTQAHAPTYDQKNASYSVQVTNVTSTSKEHINTTAKEGAPLSTSSPELALATEETTVLTTTPSATVLSAESADKYLKGTKAKAANTSIETTTEPPVYTHQSSTTVLSPVTHAPQAESHSAPHRPAPLEGSLFDYMTTIDSHISSDGTETTKASDEADITTPISVTVIPDMKKLSENTSGRFTEKKFATVVEALSDARKNWFRTVSGERPRHEEAAPQAATTPESHTNHGASGGPVSQGAPSAPTSAPITKSEMQPAAEKITNTTVSAILPQATTHSHIAQNVSTSASDSPVPIYTMLIVSVIIIIIANYFCFLHNE